MPDKYQKFVSVVLIVIVILTFQNCGPGYSAKTSGHSDNESIHDESTLCSDDQHLEGDECVANNEAPPMNSDPDPNPTPSPNTSLNDDTFATLKRTTNPVVVMTNFGFTEYELEGVGANTTIDARQSSFVVANSKNTNPTQSATCSSGNLTTNPYPIQLRDSSGIAFVGGIINGQVPQSSDWAYTYCNSATIGIWNSPNAIVDGLRASRGWDGFRFNDGTTNWKLTNSWVSEYHDDCIENDEGRTGLIKDVLFDGCYMGLSMAPGTSESGAVVTLDGVLLKMKSYLTEGVVGNGSPFKFDEETTAQLVIKNSIIAYDSSTLISVRRTGRAWNKVKECSNNQLLWMSDAEMPSDYPTPPSCFQIVKGQAARDLWQKARTNYINCHPLLKRLSTDPVSDSTKCDANFYGGKN